MRPKANETSSVLNALAYDERLSKDYVNGAPHLKHRRLRELHSSLILLALRAARNAAAAPAVLDLGAGEGAATLPFLELGARVTAVDASESQLRALREKCSRFGDRLEAIRADVSDALDSLAKRGRIFDVVAFTSFLHHLPDYGSVVERSLEVLSPHGCVLSFQDPLRYDSVGRGTMCFSRLSYYSWRLSSRGSLGAIGRYFMRKMGRTFPEYDDVEYHVTRNGVDQDAVAALLVSRGFECEIVRYFSTQSRLCQGVGSLLRLANSFGIVASRTHSSQENSTRRSGVSNSREESHG